MIGPFSTILTARGRGAIAVVRVWGPGALAAVDRVFRPARSGRLADSPIGRLRVGRVGDGLGDEVVAVAVEEGGRVEVEVQCHGGSAAVGLVVSALEGAGVRNRPVEGWARHSAGSTIRGRAAVDLGFASTARVAAILLDQAEGALDRELGRIRGLVDPTEAVERLDRLIRLAEIGVKLVPGWRVVLAGRPNVGKSRLLNALAGYDRAIVAPTPGTTRDVVTAPVAFDGWPVELADTAGLRAASDPIEAEGVARARDRQRGADLVVVVLDRSEPVGELDRAVLARHPRAVVVANKSDLPGSWDASDRRALAVSAERGDGVEALVRTIADRLVPEAPEPGSAVPFRPILTRWLAGVRRCYRDGDLDRARRSLSLGEGRELDRRGAEDVEGREIDNYI